jgi:hypothetical protein
MIITMIASSPVFPSSAGAPPPVLWVTVMPQSTRHATRAKLRGGLGLDSFADLDAIPELPPPPPPAVQGV